MLCKCTVNNTWYTNKTIAITFIICYCSISPVPFERFTQNFTQMIRTIKGHLESRKCKSVLTAIGIIGENTKLEGSSSTQYFKYLTKTSTKKKTPSVIRRHFLKVAEIYYFKKQIKRSNQTREQTLIWQWSSKIKNAKGVSKFS